MMLHSKHLLKTTGTEMVSEMFLYLAEENMIKVPGNPYKTLISAN